jgi:hypothetical protein
MAQRFTAAITRLFSELALAAEVRLRLGKDFFRSLGSRACFREYWHRRGKKFRLESTLKNRIDIPPRDHESNAAKELLVSADVVLARI